ncbi:hypothetical protein ZWY2020_041293 [Hordeum vulgare]|nr:hypothetical protein ZWY2020_041293 [Hordeum vulgare]
MYEQNFSDNSFYSHILFEEFVIVVEIPFSLRELSCPKEKEIPKFQNLRSIHSIFPFLEDTFLHLHYLSHIEIPYPIHFEILVQMVLTIRSVHLRNTTSTGISFIPLVKSYFWPTENLQIVVSLLSAKEVPSIMEELKQLRNFSYMVKTHQNS